AQRRPRRLEDDDSVARVGLQLRSPHQRRGRAGSPPAGKNRSRLRAEAAAHQARHRLRAVGRPAPDGGMTSPTPGRVAQTLGFRLAFWYAAIFTVSVLFI